MFVFTTLHPSTSLLLCTNMQSDQRIGRSHEDVTKKRTRDDCDDHTLNKKSGKWSADEEELANLLIEEFQRGSLSDCEDGCTLRSYLAKKLSCAPMRVSKKFSKGRIGKARKKFIPIFFFFIIIIITNSFVPQPADVHKKRTFSGIIEFVRNLPSKNSGTRAINSSRRFIKLIRNKQSNGCSFNGSQISTT